MKTIFRSLLALSTVYFVFCAPVFSQTNPNRPGWIVSGYMGAIKSEIEYGSGLTGYIDNGYRYFAAVNFHYMTAHPPMGYETGLEYLRLGDREVKLDYLSVPTRFRFGFFHDLFFLTAGFYFSTLLNKKQSGYPQYDLQRFQSFDFGLTGGFGLTAFSRRKYQIGISADYMRGLKSIYSREMHSPGGSPYVLGYHNRSLRFALVFGYNF